MNRVRDQRKANKKWHPKGQSELLHRRSRSNRGNELISYLVSCFETLTLHSFCWLDGNAGGSHWSEHVIDLSDESLVLHVNGSHQQRHLSAEDVAAHKTFDSLSVGSDRLHLLRRTSIEATSSTTSTSKATASSSAASSITSSEAASTTSSIVHSSWHCNVCK